MVFVVEFQLFHLQIIWGKSENFEWSELTKHDFSEKKPVLITFCLMQTYLLSKDYGFLFLVFASAGIVTSASS